MKAATPHHRAAVGPLKPAASATASVSSSKRGHAMRFKLNGTARAMRLVRFHWFCRGARIECGVGR